MVRFNEGVDGRGSRSLSVAVMHGCALLKVAECVFRLNVTELFIAPVQPPCILGLWSSCS